MKRNRISCAKIMRRRALFLDDGPCVKLRRGESFGGGVGFLVSFSASLLIEAIELVKSFRGSNVYL